MQRWSWWLVLVAVDRRHIGARSMAMASETIAGGGVSGFADGMGTEALFKSATALAIDHDNNIIVADQGNNRIRRITAAGVVSTIAGSGMGFADGVGTAASFYLPSCLLVDHDNNIIVADKCTHRIRRVTAAGVVSTIAGSGEPGFADGMGTAAQFSWPRRLAVDHDNNIIVADEGDHRIRRVTAAGVVSTIAGNGVAGFADGMGAAAQFDAPSGLAVDHDNNIIVVDVGNHRIRRITAAGVVSTIAGSGEPGFAEGVGTAAQFRYPFGLTVDSEGSIMVASENRIRKLPFACCPAPGPLSWPKCNEATALVTPGSSFIDDHLGLLRTGQLSDVCFEVMRPHASLLAVALFSHVNGCVRPPTHPSTDLSFSHAHMCVVCILCLRLQSPLCRLKAGCSTRIRPS